MGASGILPRHRLEPAIVILGCLTFAGAYWRLPLFSSNENTYFLWGLARAGYGFLSSDWLANQTDLAPAFSAIVSAVHRLDAHWLFYLLHGCLAAVYAWSLFAIARHVLGRRWSPTVAAIVVASLTFLHAQRVWRGWVGSLPDSVERLFRVPGWVTPLLTEGVAEQYILGPTLQPSAFGVLLLASVALFLRKRTRLAVVCAAGAAVVHSTYVLHAAVVVGGFLLVLLLEGRRREAVSAGLLATILLAPVALWALVRLRPTDPEALAAAQSILFSERVPHHADVAVWFPDQVPHKLALIAAAVLLLWRRERLRVVLTATSVVALCLTVLQVWSGSMGLALLFPWRASAWLVPAATAVLAAVVVGAVHRVAHAVLPARVRLGLSRLAVLVSAAFVVAACAQGVANTCASIDERRSAHPVARAVRGLAAPGQVYLVPLNLDWFRLETGMPIFVDRKSHPHRDIEVIEWYKRLQLASAFYEARSGDAALRALEEIRDESHITHVVADSSVAGVLATTGFAIVYEDDDYAVFLTPGKDLATSRLIE
jgi:hypothetical protein